MTPINIKSTTYRLHVVATFTVIRYVFFRRLGRRRVKLDVDWPRIRGCISIYITLLHEFAPHLSAAVHPPSAPVEVGAQHHEIRKCQRKANSKLSHGLVLLVSLVRFSRYESLILRVFDSAPFTWIIFWKSFFCVWIMRFLVVTN